MKLSDSPFFVLKELCTLLIFFYYKNGTHDYLFTKYYRHILKEMYSIYNSSLLIKLIEIEVIGERESKEIGLPTRLV